MKREVQDTVVEMSEEEMEAFEIKVLAVDRSLDASW
jgi:hypothetical protein